MGRWALALTVGMSLACMGDTDAAYSADLKAICEAPLKVPDDGDGMRAQKMADYLKENMKTQRARDFMQGLSSADGSQKGDILRNEATAYGITSCPIADMK